MHKLLFGLVCCVLLPSARAAQTDFRAVLELAEIDPAQLSPAMLAASPPGTWQASDWELISRILYRLQQHAPAELAHGTCWAEPPPAEPPPAAFPAPPADRPEPTAAALLRCGPGALISISGTVTQCEKITPPDSLTARPTVRYRCQFANQACGLRGTLLTAKIPRAWPTGQAEPVQLRAVLLRATQQTGALDVLLLTDHVAWYPQQAAAAGHVLLAKHGLDIGLYDEVLHRQPLVSPEISREGEAFYACLAALARIPAPQLQAACRASVQVTSEKWRRRQIQLRAQLRAQRNRLPAHEGGSHTEHAQDQKITALKQELNVAAAVVRQGQQGLSSLGPLFLDPAAEVGHLVRLVGTARRAVRIVVPERPEIEAYYEIEVFVPESPNLDNRPVVCCVNRLPAGFPQGDRIRETVEISGVFFKSWRYRTRRPPDTPGQTKRPRQLYTPLVLAAAPRWIAPSLVHSRPWSHSSWGLWAGGAFLVGLGALWFQIARVARRDRRARRTAD